MPDVSDQRWILVQLLGDACMDLAKWLIGLMVVERFDEQPLLPPHKPANEFVTAEDGVHLNDGRWDVGE